MINFEAWRNIQYRYETLVETRVMELGIVLETIQGKSTEHSDDLRQASFSEVQFGGQGSVVMRASTRYGGLYIRIPFALLTSDFSTFTSPSDIESHLEYW